MAEHRTGQTRPASAGERNLERETGFEPATSTLARSHSTTELFPPANAYRTTGSAGIQPDSSGRCQHVELFAGCQRLGADAINPQLAAALLADPRSAPARF